MFLGFLALYFLSMLVLGLVVAGSGFLPDDADAYIVVRWLVAFLLLSVFILIHILSTFLQANIYPSFSPAIGGFLALSSAYGAHLTRTTLEMQISNIKRFTVLS